MAEKNLFDAFLKISEAFNSIQDSQLLLEKVMDLAMETLGAERGFILLRRSDRQGEIDVVTARNISRQSISSIQEISSSAVNQVLQKGEPVLTVDAQTDQRFMGAESVVLQKIRSIICVPLRRNGDLIGAIYMDSRVSEVEFDQDSLKFLEAFARQIVVALENARQFQWLKSENLRLKKQMPLKQMFPEIIGRSPAIVRIFELIRDVADTNATVLIEGESGTGKELVARALHFNSSRREKPFIPIFCGSLSENLLESELFGHRKGAFTGAIENKKGLFEEADGGTIFLDEIADISKNIQTKLLRVIQEGEVKRVGDNVIRKVDVRIIAATNKDLWEEVQAGHFREDLYYRLNVINIKMPPLRERVEDIPLLAEHFLRKFAEKNRKDIVGFTPEAMNLLQEYHWPGNIRELENAIERAVILARGKEITPDLFSFRKSQNVIMPGQTLKEIEKQAVLQTLEMTGYNRTKTAEILGVSRRWLQYQLKKWGMVDGD
ncbi:MAG: sigma-54-dependent Fis family transcriptional regulator [Calditrichaeota bacterium]|nr:sigma-54-dependent Fis family transcriptional regulator [Calditrichota bacterium]